MKMQIYTVYDRTAEYSMPVFESRNDGTAMRTYQKSIIEAQDIPEQEMMLLCVGEIDHETNRVISIYPAREVRASLSLVDQMGEEDEQSI